MISEAGFFSSGGPTQCASEEDRRAEPGYFDSLRASRHRSASIRMPDSNTASVALNATRRAKKLSLLISMRWYGRLPYKSGRPWVTRAMLTTRHWSRPTPSHDYVFLAGSAIRAADAGAQ